MKKDGLVPDPFISINICHKVAAIPKKSHMKSYIIEEFT